MSKLLDRLDKYDLLSRKGCRCTESRECDLCCWTNNNEEELYAKLRKAYGALKMIEDGKLREGRAAQIFCQDIIKELDGERA